MTRTAVVLCNLGGPDRPEAIQPFLQNLFSDPAIIGLPGLLRRFLAGAISRRREKEARAIYGRIGGRSPILPETWRQAHALGEALGPDARVFVCMRYWHPMSDEVAIEVASWRPDRIVLLPLYPQYSTTTTASSVADWRRAAAAIGLSVPTSVICCYPSQPDFLAAHAALLRRHLPAQLEKRYRVLFSAHGLPEKVIRRGDPYQRQVEETAASVVATLGIADLDWVVSYQSRVGPLRWIGPATDQEIKRAGAAGVAVVLVPIAFVSEHSETLVELDLTYAALAKGCGVPNYVRVPALGTAPEFVAALATMARGAATGVASGQGRRMCTANFRACAMAGDQA
ncbi:MAG: ferrochelatase [Alphaproteobacteria bacterium]|nr:ferrochelatase [Alphaproteobacteria bacterium]